MKRYSTKNNHLFSLTHSFREGFGGFNQLLSGFLQTALLSVCIIFLLTLVNINVNIKTKTSFPNSSVWGSKPVLSYFVLTPSLIKKVQQGSGLPRAQFELVQSIAQNEIAQLRQLDLLCQPILNDPKLSDEDKRARITAMGYNQKVQNIIQSSDDKLRNTLDPNSYKRLIHWIEYRWKIERHLHGKIQKSGSSRTYQVFATRYDSKGKYTVALPDKCLKFSNAGNHLCDSDGYQTNQNYSVYLSYSKGAGATVWESGPWNVDDNFWATSSDPQPRRLFADLALGMPEAQAAYFNGYNGGQDQFGRTVTAPYGIDLARKVSLDIGLKPGVNDWITVSFLWTESWGGKKSVPATPKPGETQAQINSSPAVIPIQVATPNPDGSIIHVVQSGQTLWNIAAAYQIDLQKLLSQNNLTKDSVIFPGDKILIKSPGNVATETDFPEEFVILTITPFNHNPTPLPFMVPSTTFTPLGNFVTQPSPELNIKSTPYPIDTISAEEPLLKDPLIIIITGIFLAGVLLILAGTLFQRRH